jgi:DNA-binding transcriptional LysR family regulator
MTDLRRFDLNLLIAFDVLMRELNVSRAAEKMFITQSSMSHVLQRLRQQLDDPVLVRTSSGMKPTERALSLVEPIRAILRDVERVIRPPADFDPATSQRRFTIAATDYLEFLLLAPLIERVARAAPGIDIHVKRTETPFPVEALESGDLDVVLGFGAILDPPAQFRSQVLFDDRMACLVRADHPSVGDTLSLDEYLALPHMLISRTGAKRGIIDEWLTERGLERRVALIVPHFLSAPFIVAKTDLVLSLPFRIAEGFSRLAPLKALPVPMELPAYDLVMIWHPVRDKEPAHGWLRERIVEVCPVPGHDGRGGSTAGETEGQ